MSKLFYDHLVKLDKVEKHIKKVARTSEERDELYQLVDEIVHHKVIGCILDRLPRENHGEFLTRFSDKPHDESLLEFLKEKIFEDVEEFIRAEIHALSIELLAMVAEKTEPQRKLASKG